MTAPHLSRDSGAAPEAWSRFGWLMGAVWLVFLAFPILGLLSSAAAPWALWLGWGATLCFAIAYLVGFVVGMRAPLGETHRLARALFWVAGGCVLLTTPALGWGATSFVPFLMSFASYVLSRTAHWVVTACGIAIVVVESVTAHSRGTEPPLVLLGIVGMMATVNSINSWLIARSAKADELRLELATSEERESIARDVHDLLGHSLTVVKLKAELASRLIDRDPPAARAELAEIVRLTTEAIAGVRGTVTGLRTGGIEAQLAVSEAALASAGVELQVAGDPSALSPAQSIPAGWILREAVTNVLRHAGASHVTVEILPGSLSVTDDGCGPAARPGGDSPVSASTAVPTHVSRDAPGYLPGHGLRGMAERASAAGATLEIAQASPHGTQVSLTW